VLDLGCGTGQLTARLTERFADSLVVGVDYSDGMLEEAARRLAVNDQDKQRHLLRADAQQLPFADESFDLAVCTESFHWYPDQGAAMSGLARILRPGAHLLIASIATVTDFGESTLRAMTTVSGQPIVALTPRNLRMLLMNHGFEILHQRRVPRRGLIPWPVLTHAQKSDPTAPATE
jgi:ubiquinone/menaquinone biosynthesis C-methylase UbiE